MNYIKAMELHLKLFYARELFTSCCSLFEDYGKESADQRAISIVEYLRGISIEIDRTVDHLQRIATIERELYERRNTNGQKK